MAEGPTRLAELTNIASPNAAPRTIRFSQANRMLFQHLRMSSYPAGHSKERGATIVADGQGRLFIQNVGGLGSTGGTFSPNLNASDPAHYSVVGTFHTHPYDQSEGSMTGVSFSGADIAHLINHHLAISVVQSGPRLFAFVRTARTPPQVDYNDLNDTVNNAVVLRAGGGRTFQQASRIEAQVRAPLYALAYYQGNDGVVTRVSPA